MRRMLLVVPFTSLGAAQWPSPMSATAAYDLVQDRHSEAEKLWEKRDPAGIDIMLATLRYLDLPPVHDLSSGNQYLAARRVNIDIDLAQAYALQGKKAPASNICGKW